MSLREKLHLQFYPVNSIFSAGLSKRRCCEYTKWEVISAPPGKLPKWWTRQIKNNYPYGGSIVQTLPYLGALHTSKSSWVDKAPNKMDCSACLPGSCHVYLLLNVRALGKPGLSVDLQYASQVKWPELEIPGRLPGNLPWNLASVPFTGKKWAPQRPFPVLSPSSAQLAAWGDEDSPWNQQGMSSHWMMMPCGNAGRLPAPRLISLVCLLRLAWWISKIHLSPEHYLMWAMSACGAFSLGRAGFWSQQLFDVCPPCCEPALTTHTLRLTARGDGEEVGSHKAFADRKLMCRCIYGNSEFAAFLYSFFPKAVFCCHWNHWMFCCQLR